VRKLVKNTKGPNILFIIIDALRPRNLGCYGYSKPTSPSIDKLAKEGLLFQNAFSCSNVTDASLTTIFSGMYPLSHGILGHGGKWLGKQMGKVDTRKLDQSGIRLLPEILKAKGYTTLAVDWLGRWHKRGYAYYSGMLHEASPISFPFRKLEGFPTLMSRRYANFKKSTIIDDAQLVTEQAKLLIKKNLDKKFFLFVHYWDTHNPYAPPACFYQKVISEGMGNGILTSLSRLMKGRRSRRVVNEQITRYLASIAYIDHEIGEMLECMESYGILDKTLIILTSDHGESLTEHGIYFDHHGLYDVTIHIPLILRHPNLPNGQKILGSVQHSDLVPTILDFLGSDKEKTFDGESILPLIYEEVDQLHAAVYAEEALWQRKRSVRTSGYKYIQAISRRGAICRKCRRIHGGLEELYDLDQDPDETRNIVEERRALARQLKENLSPWLSILRHRECETLPA
jgi:arylsulfatase A-like enzyme